MPSPHGFQPPAPRESFSSTFSRHCRRCGCNPLTVVVVILGFDTGKSSLIASAADVPVFLDTFCEQPIGFSASMLFQAFLATFCLLRGLAATVTRSDGARPPVLLRFPWPNVWSSK